MYAPGGYFHATLNLDVSIAVSENMLTERNYEKASEEELCALRKFSGPPLLRYAKLMPHLLPGQEVEDAE